MTIIIKGWRVWLYAVIFCFALLGIINTIHLFIATAEYAKYGARLTDEYVTKDGKILYAIDEHGRKWRRAK